MNRAFSIYLDLLRFAAAMLVVVYHSNSRVIVEQVLPLSNYGHSAVIVFFVLSGYVIAFVTDTKETTARSYWLSRLSRVMSLAVPAVLLTPLLDALGQSWVPGIYEGNTTHDQGVLRVVTSLLFLNEIWWISIMHFSNIAYWSLNYEVWYYAVFAIYAFVATRWRWWLIGLVALLLGPKIVLLLPIWILGVVIYRWQAGYRIPEWLGWCLVAGSVVGVLLFQHWGLEDRSLNLLKHWLSAEQVRNMTFSRWFMSDYVLAGLVFLNFIGMRRIVFRLQALLFALEKPIRVAGGFTFSIYILHQPLILFWAAWFNGSPLGWGNYLRVMAAVMVSIVLIGSLTEQRRAWLRGVLERLFDGVAATAAWQRLTHALQQPQARSAKP